MKQILVLFAFIVFNQQAYSQFSPVVTSSINLAYDSIETNLADNKSQKLIDLGFLSEMNIQTMFFYLQFKPTVNFMPDKNEIPFITYHPGDITGSLQINVRDWLSYKDLEFLMSKLESGKRCKSLVSKYSSRLPWGETSNIGGFAALFLDYYKNNQKFNALVSTPQIDSEKIKELKEWWDTYKHKTIRSYKTGNVEIKTNQLKNNNPSNIDFLCRGKIVSYKNNIAIDSLKFDDMGAVGDRSGFNFSSQPVPGIIIGSKFGDYNGRMLLIDESGKIQNYAGGFFFVSKDQRYIISPWNSDLAGITVYDLQNKKLVMEQRTDIYPANWYHFEGEYYISEWGEVALEKARDPKRFGNKGETDNIYRLDFEIGELIKSTKKLEDIQKGELIQLHNTEFCDCD